MPDEFRTDFIAIIEALSRHGVRFVLIGGLAMRMHGSSHETDDLDVVYARDPANLKAVVDALTSSSPRLRVRDGEIPFLWDTVTLQRGLNFTLRTDIGDVDLLGEAAGAPDFQQLWDCSTQFDVEGNPVHVASIDALISMKQAANRTKDQLHILEIGRAH